MEIVKDNEKFSMFSWNPVFNFAIDVKDEYENKFGKAEYREYEIPNDEDGTKTVTCLEYWAYKLADEKALEKLKYLEVNEMSEFILIRYGKFSSVGEGENEITIEELWDMDNGFYLECRSIVINLKEEEIVTCPFKKFRNLNECPSNEFAVIQEEIRKAKSVEISNKLDGSMQCATWYKDSVFMTGSQAVNPEKSWRLKDGISMLTTNHKKMFESNIGLTFIFEYISLEDAHVVKYEKSQEGLYLIGIRDNYTGEQCSYKSVLKYAEKYGIKTTEVYNKSFEQILEEVKTIKSDVQEGFVINIDGHMIKVKGDDYVQIHRILSKISSVNLVIQSVAENRMDDLLSKVPKAYEQRVYAVANIVNKYISQMEQDVLYYLHIAPKNDRKEFMIWTEKNVPRKFKSYVRNKYLGKENNYIKYGSDKCPGYRKLNEMGVTDYKTIFSESEDE